MCLGAAHLISSPLGDDRERHIIPDFAFAASSSMPSSSQGLWAKSVRMVVPAVQCSCDDDDPEAQSLCVNVPGKGPAARAWSKVQDGPYPVHPCPTAREGACRRNSRESVRVTSSTLAWLHERVARPWNEDPPSRLCPPYSRFGGLPGEGWESLNRACPVLS